MSSETGLVLISLWLTLFFMAVFPLVVGFWMGVFTNEAWKKGSLLPAAAVTVAVILVSIGLAVLFNFSLQHAQLVKLGGLYCGG